jgi:hypothetical protein
MDTDFGPAGAEILLNPGDDGLGNPGGFEAGFGDVVGTSGSGSQIPLFEELGVKFFFDFVEEGIGHFRTPIEEGKANWFRDNLPKGLLRAGALSRRATSR